MFVQLLFYFVIFLIFAALIWKYVAKPVLVNMGIEQESARLTLYQDRLSKLQEQLNDLISNADAAKEIAKLTKESVKLKAEIKATEEKIKKYKN